MMKVCPALLGYSNKLSDWLGFKGKISKDPHRRWKMGNCGWTTRFLVVVGRVAVMSLLVTDAWKTIADLV